jgi:hypothetical protein
VVAARRDQKKKGRRDLPNTPSLSSERKMGKLSGWDMEIYYRENEEQGTGELRISAE